MSISMRVSSNAEPYAIPVDHSTKLPPIATASSMLRPLIAKGNIDGRLKPIPAAPEVLAAAEVAACEVLTAATPLGAEPGSNDQSEGSESGELHQSLLLLLMNEAPHAELRPDAMEPEPIVELAMTACWYILYWRPSACDLISAATTNHGTRQ